MIGAAATDCRKLASGPFAVREAPLSRLPASHPLRRSVSTGQRASARFARVRRSATCRKIVWQDAGGLL